jgi:hypothetical protein
MSFHFQQCAVRFIAGTVLVIGAVFFTPLNAVRAATVNDINVEGWYGTGANQTALIIDFSAAGATDSFAFGWNFDTPSITIYDLMTNVHNANSNFSFVAEYGGETLGYWIDSISYTTGGKTYSAEYYWDKDDVPGSLYWSYYLSSDVGKTWDYALFGVSAQTVVDDQIVGFLATAGDDYSSTPTVPVPEPSTLVLAAIGLLAALAWRRGG